MNHCLEGTVSYLKPLPYLTCSRRQQVQAAQLRQASGSSQKALVCLLGPTAVGKTEVAIALAKKLAAEIISCDSMQVYKGVKVATAVPTKAQRKAVRHHLVNSISPARNYNAACFRNSTLKIIDAIHQRERVPLIVAGSGLYLRALLDGLFSGPAQDVALRKRLYQQAKKNGRAYLYRRLKKVDPQAARAIHPHDLRRVIRALEVYQQEGQPISKLRKKTEGIRNKYQLYLFGLHRPRPELYARIEKRVDRMFRQGLVAEIRRLAKARTLQTAKCLLGYKEISGLLNGRYSLDQAKQLLKRNTRRYAKRQITWFKREKGVTWIEVDRKDTTNFIAEKILALLPLI